MFMHCACIFKAADVSQFWDISYLLTGSFTTFKVLRPVALVVNGFL